ncbi:MutS-related protein [Halostella litorea]|uniref:MutS-related protein n=1 Tax=Halostella litorea TaxID=2528831 RepID=UPI00109272E3|nr:DNA mismatch repair protein [Halostella litorea]
MRLEEYWGVGPKTRELLTEELGVEAAVEAIESADVRTLTTAGLSRGRATRILRRANGEAGMDVLATGDAREVYKELLDLAREHAVTRDAADRIQVLTPTASHETRVERLDAVLSAREAWTALDEGTRETVLDAFEAYDETGGGERPAVEAALTLREAGVTEGPFAPIADVDPEALADAADALAALDDGRVREGADEELDGLRASLAAAESLAADAVGVVEAVRDGDVRGTEAFRQSFLDHVAGEADVTVDRVRDAMPADAADATDFVARTLRELTDDLRTAVDERERAVARDLRGEVAAAREDVDVAVAAVDDIAFHLSLARFAAAHDLTRPTFVDDGVAVVGARNLTLSAGGESVQPVTYALGEHGVSAADVTPASRRTGAAAADVGVPGDERISVLTGANSGGKTTLLETVCQVVLLAAMGLPVPAERAEVATFDAVVFHRRHASFNAGVLESTLRSIVPPLTESDRTLTLVDEFEAITEPGSAADLLHGLVRLAVDEGALGTFVTHLADDLEPLPEAARTDGIFAEGLTPDLKLEVDYQPRFGTVGRSTPEFIVSRLVADAGDRAERAGFETLAEAVGHETVQRTLAEAWEERSASGE